MWFEELSSKTYFKIILSVTFTLNDLANTECMLDTIFIFVVMGLGLYVKGGK